MQTENIQKTENIRTLQQWAQCVLNAFSRAQSKISMDCANLLWRLSLGETMNVIAFEDLADGTIVMLNIDPPWEGTTFSSANGFSWATLKPGQPEAIFKAAKRMSKTLQFRIIAYSINGKESVECLPFFVELRSPLLWFQLDEYDNQCERIRVNAQIADIDKQMRAIINTVDINTSNETKAKYLVELRVLYRQVAKLLHSKLSERKLDSIVDNMMQLIRNIFDKESPSDWLVESSTFSNGVLY